MKRREFLLVPAKCLGGVLVYTLAGLPVRLAGPGGMVELPLRFFTSAQALTIAAACDRIFPSDQSGPGAREAGVVIYIDRQLAGPYGRDQFRYTRGPFFTSVPEHGYQGESSPRQIYTDGVRQLGEDFAGLDGAHQDERLRKIEAGTFFRILRAHTIEGILSDPMHGGNSGLIGWQLIGYPGPKMSYRDEIDKNYDEPFQPKSPASLEQVVGYAVKGWEEERD